MAFFRIYELNKMQAEPMINGYFCIIKIDDGETFEEMQTRCRTTVRNGEDGTLHDRVYDGDDISTGGDRETAYITEMQNNCLVNMQYYKFPCVCGAHVFKDAG